MDSENLVSREEVAKTLREKEYYVPSPEVAVLQTPTTAKTTPLIKKRHVQTTIST